MASAGQPAGTWVFGATVFLSALLLFLVQPIAAKALLPWFGGGSAVWTTALCFFQIVLLAGYCWAHVVARLSPGRQLRCHGILVAGVCGVLAAQAAVWPWPLLSGSSCAPRGDEAPVGRLLVALASGIGLPFLLLSTTTSVLQSWFRRTSGASPYWLFAVSNAGSLVGLAAYPLALEPFLPLRRQIGVWVGGLMVFAAFSVAAAVVHNRRTAALGLAAGSGGVEPAEPAAPAPRSADAVVWVGLSACSSVLLMGTTSQITEEISAVPLLWLLPLAAYLLTFVFCFSGRVRHNRVLLGLSWVVAMVGVGAVMIHGSSRVAIIPLALGFCVVLFIGCMVCHGELAQRRPGAVHLTQYNFCIALGGALGGLACGVFAPLLLPDLWELPLAYYGVAIILLLVMLRRWPARWPSGWRWVVVLPGLGLAGWVFALFAMHGVVETHRSFYGVLRVGLFGEPGQAARLALMHGRTVHGVQYQSEALAQAPNTYYTADSGVGLAFLRHPKRLSDRPLRVGVIGMGVGTAAAYGRAGDVLRVYEINPDVVALSYGPRARFTYLAKTRAQVQVALGDARLVLAREAPNRFDLLLLDAYSGDSLPVHLLTVEALALYRRHMAPGGIIAANVTNRYLKLTPLVRALAEHAGMSHATVVSRGRLPGALASTWMLLADDAGVLADETIRAASVGAGGADRVAVKVWTDEYQNPLQLLK